MVVRSACGNLDSSATTALSSAFSVDVTLTTDQTRRALAQAGLDNLNPRGGNEITMNGAGFPNSPSDASVTFSDGTVCDVTSTTPVELICITNRFDHGVAGANLDFTPDAYTMTVAVNGQSLDFLATLGVFTA